MGVTPATMSLSPVSPAKASAKRVGEEGRRMRREPMPQMLTKGKQRFFLQKEAETSVSYTVRQTRVEDTA
jgi:hypothetical protein